MVPFMAPFKTNSLISAFFKPSTQQDIGDEIVVAPRRTQPPAPAAGSASPAPPQTQTTPIKRGPGRPRKHPVSQSSQSDGTTTPRRRGRPRKHPPASSPPVKKTPRPRGRPKKSESQRQRDEQLGGASSPPISPASTDVTPTKHSPLPSPAHSPTHRVVMGVAALSPNLQSPPAEMSAPPPPKPPQSGTPADRAPNTSFSSISTLTSLAKSSQASGVPVSSNTSSKRVVSDGLQGVTGSDSESEELDDISDLYARKRQKISPAGDAKTITSAAKPPPAKETSQKGSNFFKSSQRSHGTPKLKNSLASLVAEKEKEQVSDAMIASMNNAVEESKRRGERQEGLEEAGFDADALLAAAGSDSENRERVAMALARTEALHDRNEYHFFLDPEPLHADSDFPINSLPDEPWSKIYRNETSRRQACISGFAAELATKCPLPMPVTSWMACRLLYEQSEELCEAYVEILRACGLHDQFLISDTWGSINSIYKTRSLFENNWKDQVKTALPPGLGYMIKLVSFRAPSNDSIVSEAPPDSTCAAFLDLALMNVDQTVKDSTSLSLSIADCIENMLDRLTEDSFNKLILLTVTQMFSPDDLPESVRCRAIAALPASTPRAHKLRRRLALEYFSTEDRVAVNPPDWANSISRILRTKPAFHISANTDYSLLNSLVTVLDIAIDAGWTDYSLFASREPTGPWGQRLPPTDAENRHNARVDTIADALNAIASRIRDAGTSHLRRTETKSLIEQVVARLLYCVRSRAKLRKDAFSGEEVKKMRQVTFEKSTFGRKSDPEPVPVHVEAESEAADDENGSDVVDAAR